MNNSCCSWSPRTTAGRRSLLGASATTTMTEAMQLGVLLALAVASAASGEHRVHNIVLYPERHSWCQTTPIRQVVAMAGYAARTIDNHVCVGACYSYSIPRTQPAEPGEELVGPYCDSCQPRAAKCYYVTLQRNNVAAMASNTTTTTSSDDRPLVMRKRVQIITDCGCASCARLGDGDACALDDDDADDSVDASELPTRLETTPSATASAANADVPELMAQQRLASAAHVEVALATAPTPPATYPLTASMRRLLLAIQRDDAAHGDDDHVRQLLEVVQGADGRLSDGDVVDFVNWANANAADDDVELDALKLRDFLDTFRRRHHHHHHHHVGDTIHGAGGVAHLVMGPHGSLVLAEQQRLNLASEEVAPNHEGAVIDYHHHHHASSSLDDTAR